MLPRRPEKLKARCEEAAQMKEQWILEHLEVKDLYNPRHKDPAGYYKWPLTLLANKGWEILDHSISRTMLLINLRQPEIVK